METTITIAEAKEILETPGYDAYGKLRIYAVWSGQIVSIKSTYYLEKYGWTAERIYTLTNDGTVPVRRA